jgi:hypothetical protein
MEEVVDFDFFAALSVERCKQNRRKLVSKKEGDERPPLFVSTLGLLSKYPVQDCSSEPTQLLFFILHHRMRLITWNIIFLCAIVTQFSVSQEAKEQLLEVAVVDVEITNQDVAAVQSLWYQDEIEKALKRGLEIKLSEVQLSTAESFHLFHRLTLAFSDLNARVSALEYAKKTMRV